MWHGMIWWWLVPLLVFMFLRRDHRRWSSRSPRGWAVAEGETVAELRQQVESQRAYIEELEGRLSRVEEGLEFAERMLAGHTPRTGEAS